MSLLSKIVQADGREDDLVPRKRPTTGRGGTPADDVEGGMIICQIWDVSIHRPGMASVGVQHADGAV